MKFVVLKNFRYTCTFRKNVRKIVIHCRIRLIAGVQELVSERSLMDSRIGKNSRVALVVTTHGGYCK